MLNRCATVTYLDTTELPKVLIVDDRAENHRAFKTILRDIDADFYSVYSGEEALSLILRHSFAVVLLDVMMPGMDGIETANLIRVNEESKYTPIIFVTAMDPDEEFEYRGYDAGAVDYLFKPIKPQALLGKVNVFIELEKHRRNIKRTLQAVQQLEKRNDLLLRSVGEGILGLDHLGNITFSNPAAQQLLDAEEGQLVGKNIMQIMCMASTEQAQPRWQETEVFRHCQRGMGHHENIGVFWNSHGDMFPVEYLATPIREMHSEEFIGVVFAFQDVTERKKAQDKLAQLAQIDTLTGLYNRYAFGRQLAQSQARCQRHNAAMALLFIDLDKFKQVNDTLGHEAGDALLRSCADRLLHCIRDGDIISRIGGDEFTVILESTEGGRGIAKVAEKILATLAQPMDVLGNEIFMSASIGIATYPESATDADSLLRCADIAMYKVKESGRNGFQFFTEAMQCDVDNELMMETALRNAVQHNDFMLYYQPKVDPSTGRVCGVEGLLRWRLANGEFVSPEIFIPKAEEMGLISDIGEWVLRRGCEQMVAWQALGVFTGAETVAINLSMRQLLGRPLVELVAKILAETGLSPAKLELEITESMMMQHPETTIELLRQVADLGVKLAIDDFGTGYSSLSHLREMPIHCLKIDKSFVNALDRPNGSAIVKTIIDLGKNMELALVAEGVESQSELDYMRQHGVDTIQGYYYSKPLPADKLTGLLQSNTPLGPQASTD